jgi:hypothetical protein
MTTKQFIKAFSEACEAFEGLEKTDNITEVILLLRTRIPYKVCNSIVTSSGNGIVYLCNAYAAIPYLIHTDVAQLVCWGIDLDEESDRFVVYTHTEEDEEE